MAQPGIRIVVGGEADVVRLRGALDIATVGDVRAVLGAVEDHVQLVVDLSGATLLSAAAIGLFARESVRRARAGGSLTLRNPTPVGRRCLQITGTAWLLEEEHRPTRSAEG